MQNGKSVSEGHILVGVVLLALIMSGLSPVADRGTWIMEVLPVLILMPVTVYLQPNLKLSPWTLRLMVLHALVLILGGHYTYAKVPPGEWLRELWDLERNPYDRIGHLMQGFVPAFVFRELLLKKTVLRIGLFLNVVIVAFCLSFSALYELIEWAAALILGEGANDFLGMQGDHWDTQWDMFCALIGAILALPCAARLQSIANNDGIPPQ